VYRSVALESMTAKTLVAKSLGLSDVGAFCFLIKHGVPLLLPIVIVIILDGDF
jgi:hypothetical protein